MDKLIKMKMVPIFNQDGIKKDMFISIKNKDCVPINGVISLVTESKIYYYDRFGANDYVLISSVVEGTSQIKIADSLNQHPVTHIIKEASTGASLGYTRLNIATNEGNHKVAGASYDAVVVDGIVYVKKLNS